MLLKSDSWIVKTLCWINSPSKHLPALFPLWVMSVRVGNDYTSFVRISFKKPH